MEKHLPTVTPKITLRSPLVNIYERVLVVCVTFLLPLGIKGLKWDMSSARTKKNIPAGNYMFKVNNKNTRTKV